MNSLTRRTILSPATNQKFLPFFSSYINYILQNSTPEQLFKFYQCCKYFYFKLKITIAPNIGYESYEKLQVLKFYFRRKDESYFYHSNPKIEKLWLTDKLRIHTLVLPSLHKYGRIGNEFLNKIYRNNIKKLFISSGYVLLKEFEILSSSSDLTKVVLNVYVQNNENHLTPFEKVMVLFPHVKDFEQVLYFS